MKTLHAALIGLLLSGSAAAVPIIEMSGSFEEIVPDAIQGQNNGVFYGLGSIEQTTAGYFYLQAVGLDGDQHWQLIPLDWQWTMHASSFKLRLDDQDFTLSGPESTLGPTEGMSLAANHHAVTLSYLGWPIAHGTRGKRSAPQHQATVPEPSSLALLAIGAVAAFVTLRRRGSSAGHGQ